MFTGIVDRLGVIESIDFQGDSARLALRVNRAWPTSPIIGESIAVNGVCLTVVHRRGTHLRFDLLGETIKRTNLRDVSAGDLVNLERSLRMGDGISGHLVTGHVDGTGRIVSITRRSIDWIVQVEADRALLSGMVPKGSIALDGISLTLVDVASDSFSVHIIPHTWRETNLSRRGVGSLVNLENDLLGKYVERALAVRVPSRQRRSKR